MKTWHKWTLGLLLGVIILLGAALGTLYASVDPATYRGRIEALATKAIGRDVQIRGPITLSVLPWPSIRLDDVQVDNPTGVGDAPLAHARAVRVSPRPLALVFGRLAFGTLTIDGLRLRLARDADGRTNWQGVIDAIAAGPGQALGASSASPARETPVVTPGLPVTSLAVDAVRLRGARISYDNARRHRRWQLFDARLQTGRMTDGSPFRLEASGRLRRAEHGNVARIHLVTRIEPHLADRFYRFSDMSLNLLVDGPDVPGGQQEANLGASGDVDFNSGRFGLDGVTLQSSGLTITGNVDGEGLNDRLRYYGRLTVAPFSPRSVMQQLEIEPPHTQWSAALSRAGFDAQFEGGADEIRFRQIAARLDDSHLTGSLRIADFGDPMVHFALALDTLNIDHYLPPGSAAQATGPVKRDARTAAADTDADALDFSLLRAMRLDGRLSIGALTAANMSLARASVKLSADDGRLDVDSLVAGAYGGRLDLTGAIDASAETPQYRVRGDLRHIALGPLLGDAVMNRRVSGLGDFDIDLSARGRRVADLKRSLAGTFALRLTDGKIDGYDLANALHRAAGNANNSTGNASAPHTAIESLAARFVLKAGVATNEDLSLVTPRLVARGDGLFNIPANRFDYQLLVAVPADADAPLAALAGQSVPVALDGSLLAPSPAIGQPTPAPRGDAEHRSPSSTAGSTRPDAPDNAGTAGDTSPDAPNGA
ncbi:AsmA family protein [Salinisphaera sp. Q1T1-3]|uniref:AsmA family protein n=1 Tax=Salinisphaera sp. Q1T1-3 TaxID=2321229 RepID=UPI001314CA0F|nr:AsmA family protein [Salinisphaera sp. Q1T1-3]